MWAFLKFWQRAPAQTGLTVRSTPRAGAGAANAPQPRPTPSAPRRIPRATLRKRNDPCRVAVIQDSRLPVFDKPRDHA